MVLSNFCVSSNVIVLSVAASIPMPNFVSAVLDPSKLFDTALVTASNGLPVATEISWLNVSNSCDLVKSPVARNRRDKAGRITSSVVAVAMLCAVTYLSMPAICSVVAFVVLRIVSWSLVCAVSSSAAALTAANANAPIAAPAIPKATAAFLPKSPTLSANVSTSA